MARLSLASRRERRGLSLVETARTARLNVSTVIRIEGGQRIPRKTTAKKLARVFNCTPAEIVLAAYEKWGKVKHR
jgi:transcriptional regulator with XRE-family HTH domain